MKKSKVVIPALGLIALSTAASITGTVAWFSANTSVAIKGMQVKTQVSSNLLIADDTLDSAAKKTESQFSSGPLNQTKKAFLEPVSTVNGKDFFYTLKAKADGSKEDGNYVAYDANALATDSAYGNKFSQDYGVLKTTVQTWASKDNAEAYVDYVFQVKATSTVDDSRLIVSQLNLIYGATSEATNKAFRSAFFVKDITTTNPTANDVGDLVMIYAPSSAAYFTANKAVARTNDDPSTAGTNEALDAVAYNTANTPLASDIDAGATKYYKVVVRLWLEGEDTTCNNQTYAALTSDWSLNIELKLDKTAAPVSAMAKYTSYVYAGNSKTYYFDGTNVYKEADNGAIDTTPLTSTSIGDATLESALETAFGITID